MANTGGDIYPRPQTAPDPLATAEVLKAGKFSGLKGRWLAHAVDDQDAGYTLSLWENEAAMRIYENSAILQKTIQPRLKPFFSGRLLTTRCGSGC